MITWSSSWPDQPAHVKRLQGGWRVRIWCVAVVAGRVASGPWMSQPLGPSWRTPGTNQGGCCPGAVGPGQTRRTDVLRGPRQIYRYIGRQTDRRGTDWKSDRLDKNAERPEDLEWEAHTHSAPETRQKIRGARDVQIDTKLALCSQASDHDVVGAGGHA